MDGHTVIVCGGRGYGEIPEDVHPDIAEAVKQFAAEEVTHLCSSLDHLHRERPFVVLVHGAATGADRHAAEWAKQKGGIKVIAERADWDKHGRAAGPIRNKRMLSHFPDFVIAFDGDAGTSNMIEQALRAKVEVVVAFCHLSGLKRGVE
jgi:hypothetical protein